MGRAILIYAFLIMPTFSGTYFVGHKTRPCFIASLEN
jgi:hypothetical protein